MQQFNNIFYSSESQILLKGMKGKDQWRKVLAGEIKFNMKRKKCMGEFPNESVACLYD